MFTLFLVWTSSAKINLFQMLTASKSQRRKQEKKMAFFLSQSHEYQSLSTEPSYSKLNSHSFDQDEELRHCEVTGYTYIYISVGMHEALLIKKQLPRTCPPTYYC